MLAVLALGLGLGGVALAQLSSGSATVNVTILDGRLKVVPTTFSSGEVILLVTNREEASRARDHGEGAGSEAHADACQWQEREADGDRRRRHVPRLGSGDEQHVARHDAHGPCACEVGWYFVGWCGWRGEHGSGAAVEQRNPRRPCRHDRSLRRPHDVADARAASPTLDPPFV